MEKDRYVLLYLDKERAWYALGPAMSQEEAEQVMWEIPQKQKDGDPDCLMIKGAKIVGRRFDFTPAVISFERG